MGVLGGLGVSWGFCTGLPARLVVALQLKLSASASASESESESSKRPLILVGVAGRSGSSNSGL